MFLFLVGFNAPVILVFEYSTESQNEKSPFKNSRNRTPVLFNEQISNRSPSPETIRHGFAVPILYCAYLAEILADSNNRQFGFRP